MKNVSLLKYVEGMSECAQKLFLEFGEISPMYHAIDRNGDNIVFPAPPFEKDEAVRLVRIILEALGATRVTFVSEGWILETSPGEADVRKIMREGIADHPDRIEVIMLSVEDSKEGVIMASRKIIRDGDKVTLGDLNIMPSKNGEGRMIGLLPKSAETLH